MDEQPGPSQSTSNQTELSTQHSRIEIPILVRSMLGLSEPSPNLRKSADSLRIGPSHNKEGKRLCQVCFELDEAAFKDQTNYSILWESLRPPAKLKCKTCSLLRSSISQSESLWVKHPSKIPYAAGWDLETVNVSATAEDGLIVSFRSLKLELYRRPGTLYLVREHIRVRLHLGALVTARTLLPKISKLNIHLYRTNSCRFLEPMENIEAISQLKSVDDDSRETTRSPRFTI